MASPSGDPIHVRMRMKIFGLRLSHDAWNRVNLGTSEESASGLHVVWRQSDAMSQETNKQDTIRPIIGWVKDEA